MKTPWKRHIWIAVVAGTAVSGMLFGLNFGQLAVHARSSNDGSIECQVKDSKGVPTRAVVVLHARGTTMQRTDEDGHIAFSGLRAGKYQVAFCADGFYPELKSIRVKSGKVARVRVRLRTSGNATSGCEGLGKP